jgi:AAA15 family ATPase/GTPase
MSVQEMAKDRETGGLILDSLEVKNFRAFRHLTIEKLGRVNLITGKNNVGKSSLLEALWVYLSLGSPRVLHTILSRRDELQEPMRFTGVTGFMPDDINSETGWMPYLSTLFHNRRSIFHLTEPFTISGKSSSMKSLSVDLSFFIDDKSKPISGTEELGDMLRATPLIQFQYGERWREKLTFEEYARSSILWAASEEQVRGRYLPPNGLDRHGISVLWDAIALTDAEKDVVDMMRFVAPGIEKVNLVASRNDTERVPFVKITNQHERVPLHRLGEGVNRLFGMALSLVESSNGVCLIDEIENGLHYSVQYELWKLIFNIARRSNVQVFATTHSWGCIEAFQEAASEDGDPGSGVLIRLQNKSGNVVSTVFDEQRLGIVTREGIEVR